MDNEMDIMKVAELLEDYLKRIVAMLKQCFAWFDWAKEAVTKAEDETFDYDPEQY